MSDQDALMQMLTAADIPCHVIVTSHLKMIGPKVEAETDKDSEVTQIAKEVKARAAEMIPTRFYPSAIGQGLPPLIAQHFPAAALAELEEVNGKVRRVIRTQPRPDCTVIGVPGKGLPPTLPLESGLLTIFNALLKGGTEPAQQPAHAA
jgi:hypothetical protein